MCGIFGISVSDDSGFGYDELERSVKILFHLSQSRGKEASGLAVAHAGDIRTVKRAKSGDEFARSSEFSQILSTVLGDEPALSRPLSLIGHCRFVTDGGSELHDNNQPVIDNGLVVVHNGIVVNVAELYKIYDLKRNFEVDTEVLVDLIRHFCRQGHELPEALRRTFQLVRGTASIALLAQESVSLFLATNCGSLYFSIAPSQRALVFASEENILRTFIVRNPLGGEFKATSIHKLMPRTAVAVTPSDKHSVSITSFELRTKPISLKVPQLSPVRRIRDEKPEPLKIVSEPPKVGRRDLLRFEEEELLGMRRCTRCVLPESFPFLEFDSDGICNICSSYRPTRPSGREAILEHLASSGLRRPKILAAVSGGRDSCFMLHYLVKEMGFNIVAFSYDWGMVTDLARRNISRMCERLEIEHIIVSPNISLKRENIRKNVLAWLKHPHPGTIPLFMAGDKQFFFHADRIRKQTGCDSLIFGMNPLEKTDFKIGFAGIESNLVQRHYHLTCLNQIRMLWFYIREFLRCPAFLNSSLFDSAFAFASYYLMRHHYLIFYEFIPWHEETIVSTIIEKYDWETSPDSFTTWRIGDGTAAFYNYLYLTLTGFTESDSFRSNQVREGALTRKQALKLVIDENRPRYESISWYCKVIGLDFDEVISRVEPFRNKWRRPNRRSVDAPFDRGGRNAA